MIPLRPLSVAELLDGAISTVRRHPRALMVVAAAVAGAQALLTVLLPALLGGFDRLRLPTTNAANGTADQSVSFAANGVSNLGQLVGTVLAALFTGYVAVVVSSAVLGRPVQTRAALRRTRERAWALVGVSLLTRLGPLLLLVVAVLVGIAVGAVLGAAAGVLVGLPLGIVAAVLAVYLYVGWTFAPPVLVLERAGVFRSMRRSRSLVRGAWWRVLGITLLAGLISGILAGILTIPVAVVGFGTVAAGGPSGALIVATALAGAAVSVVTLPFSAAVRALLYVERRIRVEALDVALAAAE